MNRELLRQINRALEVTDALGLHREAVEVSLDQRPGGSAAIQAGKLVIHLPESDVDAFLAALPERAAAGPGFASLRRMTPPEPPGSR